MRVAIVGAGGTIAPAIARDLAASDEVDALTLLDLDGERAQAVADRQGGEKATASAVDAGDRDALAKVLTGHDAVVNAASYRINLAVMDAALAARCAYLDLGGLYHVSAQQYEQDARFRAAGLVAVLGCGAGPGKTNLMAARAARELDAVEGVRCASAGLDETPPPGLSTPYALQTLLDELTIAPMVVRDGRAQAIDPLTEGGAIPFPDPIGRRDSLYTLHSEVLTLPRTLGATDCDFRLSLAPAVHAALLELVREPRDGVRPAPPSARTWSAQHVEVTGTRDGLPARATMTALTEPHTGWGLGGGIVSTASCAAAVVRLYARGELAGRTGVLAPEEALEPEAVFAELDRRGCRFALEVVAG